jgi:hypothetical protein
MLWGGNLYVSVLIAFSWLHTVICYPHSFPSTPIELHCIGSNNSSLQPSCFTSHGTCFTHGLYTMKYLFVWSYFQKVEKILLKCDLHVTSGPSYKLRGLTDCNIS